ncbi:hypothetical protein [Streptomyces sp. CB01201]|nr:hypothetical protein [Streptomyces sp. CB01201]
MIRYSFSSTRSLDLGDLHDSLSQSLDGFNGWLLQDYGSAR